MILIVIVGTLWLITVLAFAATGKKSFMVAALICLVLMLWVGASVGLYLDRYQPGDDATALEVDLNGPAMIRAEHRSIGERLCPVRPKRRSWQLTDGTREVGLPDGVIVTGVHVAGKDSRLWVTIDYVEVPEEAIAAAAALWR
jgi:hypothetical protein